MYMYTYVYAHGESRKSEHVASHRRVATDHGANQLLGFVGRHCECASVRAGGAVRVCGRGGVWVRSGCKGSALSRLGQVSDAERLQSTKARAHEGVTAIYPLHFSNAIVLVEIPHVHENGGGGGGQISSSADVS